jgi:hypothetical protein
MNFWGADVCERGYGVPVQRGERYLVEVYEADLGDT